VKEKEEKDRRENCNSRGRGVVNGWGKYISGCRKNKDH
jgi:hypothetical protein